MIKDNVAKIDKCITNAMPWQTVWLVGTNAFADLKSKGASLMSLDAGILNIWADNNRNQFVSIPKLFFGLNFYLKPTDKNANPEYLHKLTPTGTETFSLNTQPSVWNNVCITAGFTLGAMQNKDFDNITNGLSFTLGPSIRFLKVLRFSVGAAAIRRVDADPLLSDKPIVLGCFAGLSVDFDAFATYSKYNFIII